MQDLGFENLLGVEVAEEEARALTDKGLPVAHRDALDMFTAEPAESIDVVVAKAVLEHISKDGAVALFREIVRVMKPSGIVLIDVPNMDWILSGHERYMDLTHQTGYTRESLRQFMSLFFDQVVVTPASEPTTSLRAAIRLRLLRPIVVSGFRMLLRMLGEGASDVMFESRSIIAVARLPRR
jgi:SAM-dependent methyltransferase